MHFSFDLKLKHFAREVLQTPGRIKEACQVYRSGHSTELIHVPKNRVIWTHSSVAVTLKHMLGRLYMVQGMTINQNVYHYFTN